MVEVTQEREIPTKPENMCMSPNDADWELMVKLRRKLGAGNSVIFRLALRALAAKEGIA